MKSFKVYGAFALAAVMLVVMALLFSVPAPVTYADTVPTPISAQAGSGTTGYLVVTFASASAKTADGGSSAFQLPGYDSLDIQYVVDQGTVNTTTIKLQYSNDNSNWSDGPNIVAANAADADSMVQAANMGRYTRVYFDVTNSNAVTWTVIAVAKP